MILNVRKCWFSQRIVSRWSGETDYRKMSLSPRLSTCSRTNWTRPLPDGHHKHDWVVAHPFITTSAKSSSVLDYERWAPSWSRFLGSQSADDLVINPVVGCRYFPSGSRLLSQSKRSILLADTKLYCVTYQIILLGDRGTQV